MKVVFCCFLTLFCVVNTQAINRTWNNPAGGDWSVPGNWLPPAVPNSGDNVIITNNGTFTVTILSNSVTVGTLLLGGASGSQTLLNGTLNVLTMTNSGVVSANGILAMTNGGLIGSLLVQTGGQLDFKGIPKTSDMQLYNCSLTNLGTVNWSGGFLSVGGNNFQTTMITNSGLWLMTSDDQMAYGGGSAPTFRNSGIIDKAAGTGTSSFNGIDLINLSSGLVEVASGTLNLSPSTTNYIGGSFTAAAATTLNFLGGNWSDAGGVVSGSGTIQFNGGNFYFRTNIIAGLPLIAGNLYINTNTFQQGGAITNLTIDGATLYGTNRIAGTLTVNSGGLVNQLTVLPSGQLLFNTSASKALYYLTLINQGTVMWNEGFLQVGGNSTTTTVISNGGSWQLSSDDTMGFGGGSPSVFNNYGVIHKIAGTGTSSFSYAPVNNETGGLIEVDTGILSLPSGYTNLAGTLQLNGGQLTELGGLAMSGGTLDGSGGLQQNALTGGTISPGLSAPGLIGFTSGLNLGSNTTLVINGTSASQYDQLSVTGAVSLASATLQVNSLPTVPLGTTFVIINNDGADAVSGTFNGLPDSSLFTVSGQLFRIHYAGGSGNDVTLVRDNGQGPLLSVSGSSYSNSLFHLAGASSASSVFTIQASTNFIQWTNIGTATGDVNGKFNFIDTNAPRFRYRFYRTTN